MTSERTGRQGLRLSSRLRSGGGGGWGKRAIHNLHSFCFKLGSFNKSAPFKEHWVKIRTGDGGAEWGTQTYFLCMFFVFFFFFGIGKQTLHQVGTVTWLCPQKPDYSFKNEWIQCVNPASESSPRTWRYFGRKSIFFLLKEECVKICWLWNSASRLREVQKEYLKQIN